MSAKNLPAQIFSNVGHSYSHVFTMLYPTVVLALDGAWGLGYGELLQLALPGFLLFGLGALPAGWLGDRWSARGMMAVYFFGIGAAAIATGLTSSPLGLACGLGAIGLFASIYHPVGTAWLIRTAVKQGKALGINGVFGSVGFASASLIAGLLVEISGWRAAFIVPGAVAVATGLVFLVFLHQGRIENGGHRVKSAGRAPTRQEVVRVFWLLSVTMIATGLIFQSMTIGLPKIFETRGAGFGGGIAGVAGMVTLVSLIAGAGQLAGGLLSDRGSMKAVYVWAFVAQIPLLAVSALVFGPLLAPVIAVAVIANVAALPSESGLLAAFTPGRWQATAFGAKFVFSIGVSGLAVPLVGAIFEFTGGFGWLFALLTGAAAVAALAAIALPDPQRLPGPAVAPAAASALEPTASRPAE